MKWLKAELHSHAGEDKKHELSYSVRELIDQARKCRYDVLGLTFHDKVFEGPEFEKSRKYALGKKILLMAGCEATIEGKHTLVYGITDSERKKIKSFRDLRRLKKEFEKNGRNILIIAPHPFYSTGIMGKYCLGRKLVKNIDIFDAIEYSFFYLKRVNRNKKAVKIAKRYLKPMVGNGDIHVLSNLDRTYSMILAKKDPVEIMNAIKENHVKVVSKPLTMRYVVKLAYFHSFKS
jgi:predicted metal-dependent phosphoesterase TrpH